METRHARDGVEAVAPAEQRERVEGGRQAASLAVAPAPNRVLSGKLCGLYSVYRQRARETVGSLDRGMRDLIISNKDPANWRVSEIAKTCSIVRKP